jgi:hypothetical protein
MSSRHVFAWLIATGLSMAASPVAGQRVITTFGTGEIVEHRIRFGAETERVSGTMWGAGGALAFADWFGVRGRIASGALSGKTAKAENRTLAELDLGIVFVPDRWVELEVGPRIRTVQTSLATQRWVELRAGAEVGLAIIEGMLRGTIRGSVAPSVDVSGHPSPDLSIGAGTGLEYTSGRLVAGLFYTLDRYDFPSSGAGVRLEQHSALFARVGWRIR